jgi:hypothetical protein
VQRRAQRHRPDLPGDARAVHIQWMVRHGLCRNPGGTRRLVTERLPPVGAPAARNPHRLVTVLQAIAMGPRRAGGGPARALAWRS